MNEQEKIDVAINSEISEIKKYIAEIRKIRREMDECLRNKCKYYIHSSMSSLSPFSKLPLSDIAKELFEIRCDLHFESGMLSDVLWVFKMYLDHLDKQ